MTKLAQALLVACCAGMTFEAGAQFYTGHMLKQRLEDDGIDRAVGMGYVLGVTDALEGRAFCTPAAATSGQLAEVVSKYLAAHPEGWHKSADDLTAQALAAVFPCMGKK
jgi:hypothetical protein